MKTDLSDVSCSHPLKHRRASGVSTVLRFSITHELYSSKPKLQLRFTTPSIIITSTTQQLLKQKPRMNEIEITTRECDLLNLVN